MAPGGRLTLTSGTPVAASDVTGATDVYYTPYTHDVVWLWTGTTWYPVQFSETTLALGTITADKPYDVFGYLTGSSLAVEALVWTDDTTRATAVTLQDGRYCKSGDKTRLYLGSFYTTATTTTEDSNAKRYLFNAYNRVGRSLSHALETTNSWTYSTQTFRQANGNTANQVNYLDGLGEVSVSATARALCSANAGPTSSCAGIGIDSTSTNSAVTFGANISTAIIDLLAHYVGVPGAGRHYLAWLEYGGVTNTTTWRGDNNSTLNQSGLVASLSTV